MYPEKKCFIENWDKKKEGPTMIKRWMEDEQNRYLKVFDVRSVSLKVHVLKG